MHYGGGYYACAFARDCGQAAVILFRTYRRARGQTTCAPRRAARVGGASAQRGKVSRKGDYGLWPNPLYEAAERMSRSVDTPRTLQSPATHPCTVSPEGR